MDVFPQHRLKIVFVEGIHPIVRETTRQYISDNPNYDLCELARHASSMEYVSRGTTKSTPSAGARSADGRQCGRDGTVLTVLENDPCTAATSTNGIAYDQGGQALAFGAPATPTLSYYTPPTSAFERSAMPSLHFSYASAQGSAFPQPCCACMTVEHPTSENPAPVCDSFQHPRTSAELVQIREENYRGLKAAV